VTEFEELLESLLVERYRPRPGRPTPMTREALIDELSKERPRGRDRVQRPARATERSDARASQEKR
jgi:hypothetical protein